ncbi:LysR substrate-binding domain-containing protein [Hyphobacterium sp. HN65]|uniref:LysR substrate-binding domain-containing protein n=1 Tax=Hyphobacterium lacteum TaxID=3116575 RepID=A0ABU7LLF2_9PROT|nr:LysR substrate-binding domain-containing protein [Hyphobacterium sp. HN65]MEE2524741.1 LysR substrate-binding domain-containing protein [Hyphobacterium sp. HN65]
MPNALHPDLLRAFVAVVDHQGFSAAAKRLNRGQSAVSLQIKRLEERLGVQLLERNPHLVRPTNEGEALLEQARKILSLHDDLANRFDKQALTGVVRLGAPEDFATSHLPGVLSRFSRSHPGVVLEVTCELTLDLINRFEAGGLDLALVKREPGAGVAGRRVWREPLVWVANSEDILKREDLPLVVSPSPCVYRSRATQALDSAGRHWRIAYTCTSLAGTHAAVRAGLGVSVLPKEMVPSDLTLLDGEESGLPDLQDTEMALIEAPSLPVAAERLRETIIRELEHGPTAG